MKTANSLITLILLMTAVFSVVTSSAAYASTNESEGDENGNGNGNGNGDGGEGSENGDGNGNGGEALPAEPELAVPAQPEAAAPALSIEEDNTFEVECWNGELVNDIDDCPVDEGNIVCDDGSFALRINDCPTGSSPPPNADNGNGNQRGNLKVIVSVENWCGYEFTVDIRNADNSIRDDDNNIGRFTSCSGSETVRVNADVGESFKVCADGIDTDNDLYGCTTVRNGEEKESEHATIFVS